MLPLLVFCHHLLVPTAVVLTAKKCITVWDSHHKAYRFVLPVLLLAFADTPQRRAWALKCGHSGRTGCDKCGLRATRHGADGMEYASNCFRGYAELAPTSTWMARGQLPRCSTALMGTSTRRKQPSC